MVKINKINIIYISLFGMAVYPTIITVFPKVSLIIIHMNNTTHRSKPRNTKNMSFMGATKQSNNENRFNYYIN